MVLTMPRLGILLPESASVPSTPMRLSSVGLTSVVLRWMVSQYSSVLCFGSSLSLAVFAGLLRVSFPPLYGPGGNLILSHLNEVYINSSTIRRHGDGVIND